MQLLENLGKVVKVGVGVGDDFKGDTDTDTDAAASAGVATPPLTATPPPPPTSYLSQLWDLQQLDDKSLHEVERARHWQFCTYECETLYPAGFYSQLEKGSAGTPPSSVSSWESVASKRPTTLIMLTHVCARTRGCNSRYDDDS